MNRRPKTGGRTKGTPNRTTASVKAAILEAFELAGGVNYLVAVAKADPKTFCALLGRVLPMDIAGAIDGAVTIQIVTGVERSIDSIARPLALPAMQRNIQ